MFICLPLYSFSRLPFVLPVSLPVFPICHTSSRPSAHPPRLSSGWSTQNTNCVIHASRGTRAYISLAFPHNPKVLAVCAIPPPPFSLHPLLCPPSSNLPLTPLPIHSQPHHPLPPTPYPFLRPPPSPGYLDESLTARKECAQLYTRKME